MRQKFEQIKSKMFAVIEEAFKMNPLKKNVNRIELMNMLDVSMDDILFTQLVETLCSGGKRTVLPNLFENTGASGWLTAKPY